MAGDMIVKHIEYFSVIEGFLDGLRVSFRAKHNTRAAHPLRPAMRSMRRFVAFKMSAINEPAKPPDGTQRDVRMPMSVLIFSPCE